MFNVYILNAGQWEPVSNNPQGTNRKALMDKYQGSHGQDNCGKVKIRKAG